MCGIVGRLSDRPVTEAEIGRMCDAIVHPEQLVDRVRGLTSGR